MTPSEQTTSARSAGGQAGFSIQAVVATAKAVITDPVSFYKGMPTSGGFGEPIFFVVVMAAVSAVLGAVLSIFGAGFAPTLGAALISILLMPIFAGVLGFVGAGVLFAVWRMLGSQESYETAYRCGAYSMAIAPITTVLGILPYLGTLIAIGWGFYLVVVASEHVHKVAPQTARIAFGVLFGIFALMSISSQMAARRMQGKVEALHEEMEKLEEMSPEEAGKAVGEFLKGLQKSVEPESDQAPPVDSAE
ncbi:MAG TPA: YIP1 family protein [Candidatus Binatia bacterium]|nr:YIP1 family protein [Candidatus Binatia bacterium]